MLHELEAKGQEHSGNIKGNGLSRNTVREIWRSSWYSRKENLIRKEVQEADPVQKILFREMINSGIFNCEVIYERMMKAIQADVLS